MTCSDKDDASSRQLERFKQAARELECDEGSEGSTAARTEAADPQAALAFR